MELDEIRELIELMKEHQIAEIDLERTKIKKQEARRDRNRDFDLVVREVTFFDRDENRWDASVKGVIVEQAERAGWVNLGGVHPDDLIQRIDNYAISSLKDYRKAMQDVTAAKRERVVFVVLRGARTRYQYIEPDWTPGGDRDTGKKEPEDARDSQKE